MALEAKREELCGEMPVAERGTMSMLCLEITSEEDEG